MSKKIRLDVLVTERGLCESRQKAQATIMAGGGVVGRGGGHGGDRSTRTFRRGVRRCLGRTAFLLPDHVAEAGKCLIQTADLVD